MRTIAQSSDLMSEIPHAFLSFFGGDAWSSVVWVIMFVFFMLFYQRIMITQIIFKLENSARMVEGLGKKAKNTMVSKISKLPNSTLRGQVSDFMEFFSIAPVSLDPYGIVKKLEHISQMSDDRFRYFVDQVVPKADEESKQDIIMGLSGAVQLNQIAKIVRHYVELIRKTKNLQLAMVLQMQLPMVEKISKSLLKGTEALSNGWPIGDSIGCMVAAELIGNAKPKATKNEVVVASRKIAGKNAIIMKAKGPGGRLGRLGKETESILSRGKISKIITVDAAAKLEGEKTGRVAEGVGVAIGGIGVDRSYIEDLAVKKNIPLDSVVVKMSQEEAIEPIKAEVLGAMPTVLKIVEDRVKATKGKGTVLVIGVGNTAGVGNDKSGLEKGQMLARKVMKIVKKREAEEKELEKKNKWKNFLMGG